MESLNGAVIQSLMGYKKGILLGFMHFCLFSEGYFLKDCCLYEYASSTPQKTRIILQNA